MKSYRTYKSAWVIYQEGSAHPTEVIGILSARKSPETVKGYVEWIYALLNYNPEEHFDYAKYTKPHIPYEAQYSTTNIGVKVSSALTCGHNPYLIACHASNVHLVKSTSNSFHLEWSNPVRIIQDRITLEVIKKVPGRKMNAPIRLPLQLYSEEEPGL